MNSLGTGSRRSNSGTSSRGGSGISALSDHRGSPISGRGDYRTTHSGGTVQTNQFSTTETSTYTSRDLNTSSKFNW